MNPCSIHVEEYEKRPKYQCPICIEDTNKQLQAENNKLEYDFNIYKDNVAEDRKKLEALLSEAVDLLSRVPRYDNQSAQLIDKVEALKGENSET